MPVQDPDDVDRRAILAQLESFASLTGGVEDNECYLRSFADDAMILPPDRPALKGRLAISAFYDEVMQEVASARVTYGDVVIHVDRTLAVRHYTGAALITQKGAATQREARTKYIDVLKKHSNGCWQVIMHMWSANAG